MKMFGPLLRDKHRVEVMSNVPKGFGVINMRCQQETPFSVADICRLRFDNIFWLPLLIPIPCKRCQQYWPNSLSTVQ